MIKKIGVLTSGGDAPGMNAAIRAVVRNALSQGIEVVGIKDGYKGLMEENFIPLTRESVSNIISMGGTILGSARHPIFRYDETRKAAADILRKHGIDGVVVIGGDGTYNGALGVTGFGVPCIGVPGTIDNDIASTDYTIGFHTAVQTAVEAIDKLRDTCRSHVRCSVVEVMGRYCGDIAYQAGLSAGADLVITEETGINEDEIFETVKRCQRIGKRHCIIVISELMTDVVALAKKIEQMSGYETRATTLGHIQRGGSPVPQDRVLATLLGASAVDQLVAGKGGVCMGMVAGKIVTTPISEALEMKKHLLSNFADIVKRVR